MEITVTGRHVTVPTRFRRHIKDKLRKVPQLDWIHELVSRCDVVVTHEANPRQAKEAERIEITCHAKRSIIRAEACADEKHVALDLAMTRLGERLRRLHDKRRVHRGRRQPMSVHEATATLIVPNDTFKREETPLPPYIAAVGGDDDCPIKLREKIHISEPMGLDQALNEMELVGHDFYLYQDAETGKPCVVYRRRGWSYGVIQLDVVHQSAAATTA